MIAYSGKKSEGASNGVLPFEEIALGGQKIFVCSSFLRWEAKKFLFVSRFRVEERKIFVRCLLLRWGTKKFLFVARFCVGEAPPIWVFVKIASGRGKPFRVVAAFALGEHHPNGFSAKSRRDDKNLFGWCPLSRWGSTTPRGFTALALARTAPNTSL
ncbi:MAG: hypothetical protein HDR39_00010 [Treponema sp.]|nr:hypothetical protein [Treponema sp.]